MGERADDAVGAAIAGAIVDLEAQVGQRVRFGPRELAAVVELGGSDHLWDLVMDLVRARLDVAIMGEGRATAGPVEWHDAYAAQALLNLLEATRTEARGDETPGG